MWDAVGEASPQHDTGKVVMVPHIRFRSITNIFINMSLDRKTVQKMDWSNSLWGFILGLLILLINIASLVIFFSISSKDDSVDEYVGKVIHSVTNCYGIGAVIYGLICIQRLVEKSDPEPALMDRFLLKLSAMLVIVYTCFTITVGIFPTDDVEDIPGELHIVDGILNLVETVLQVVFIELLLTKTIRYKSIISVNQQPPGWTDSIVSSQL